MTGAFVLATLGLLAASWILYDLAVIARDGLDSGRTISWTVYAASRRWPGIPLLAGLALGLLLGHLFLGMCE